MSPADATGVAPSQLLLCMYTILALIPRCCGGRLCTWGRMRGLASHAELCGVVCIVVVLNLQVQYISSLASVADQRQDRSVMTMTTMIDSR
jgi:hypothetical protein